MQNAAKDSHVQIEPLGPATKKEMPCQSSPEVSARAKEMPVLGGREGADEEIFNLGFKTAYLAGSPELLAYEEGIADGATAQLIHNQQAMAGLQAELESPCPHVRHVMTIRPKRACDICWDEIKAKWGV